MLPPCHQYMGTKGQRVWRHAGWPQRSRCLDQQQANADAGVGHNVRESAPRGPGGKGAARNKFHLEDCRAPFTSPSSLLILHQRLSTHSYGRALKWNFRCGGGVRIPTMHSDWQLLDWSGHEKLRIATHVRHFGGKLSITPGRRSAATLLNVSMSSSVHTPRAGRPAEPGTNRTSTSGVTAYWTPYCRKRVQGNQETERAAH
jgi:hypothetical protein